MSNPYAPPDDRPRTDAEPTPSGPPATGGTPDRSPEGVPYERPRAAVTVPPARPEDLARVASATRATALLVLAAMVTGLLGFPWFVAAGVMSLVALVVGLRGLTVAARTRVRGMPRTVIVLLLVVAVLGLARPAQAVLMWPVESQYAQCRAGAVTVQASHACLSRYEAALDERLQSLVRPAP